MDLSKKDKMLLDLQYVLHTRGIGVYFPNLIKFRPSDHNKFDIWYDDLTDEQQWKVLLDYAPLTRRERRH